MAHFLRPCLDSILSDGLNHCNFEVVAVDDASEDESGNILDAYAKTYKRLRIIRFSENRGVSAARNAGVDASCGTYVMFCDPDDSYVPGAVDCIAAIVKESNPDLVFFRHVECLGQSSADEGRKAPPAESIRQHVRLYDMKTEAAEEGFQELFTNLWTWNGAFHRRLFANMRFNERLWPSEDVLGGVTATCRCATAAVADTVLYRYNQRPDSCLHRVFLARVKSEIIGIGEFAQEARAWPFYHKVAAYVFKPLRRRAFIRPVKALRQLPRNEQDEAWQLLFDTYFQVFNLSDSLLDKFISLILKWRSKFLVVNAISRPLAARVKGVDYLYNIGIRKRIRQLLPGLSARPDVFGA